jgi:hypothetical protein
MVIEKPFMLLLIVFLFLFVNKKNFLYILSVSFLVFALSGVKAEKYITKKVLKDIFVLIDNTYSMMCDDLKPSRIALAKKYAIKLIKDFNNVGVLSFDKGIDILCMPYDNKEKCIKKIKALKPKKIRTDISMALNFVNNLSDSKKTIIVLSDGGERKIKGDFIFLGLATSNGAKVPGFDEVSRLNIIGDKYFSYTNFNNLIKYLKNSAFYEVKLKSFKNLSFDFVLISFIIFLIALIKERVL